MSEKIYSQEELDEKLKEQEEELKEKAKDWVREKADKRSEEMLPALAEEKAKEITTRYENLPPRMQDLENDKQELQFYIDGGALPENLTLAQLVMCRQLGKELDLSLMQTINGIAFVNGKPAVYGETYLALITKNGYKIRTISESAEKVEIEIEGPDGEKQKGSYTKAEAELSGQWKMIFLKYPARMLRYKAIRNAQNIMCPHIMGGAYLVDEAKEVAIDENMRSDKPDDEVVDAVLEGFGEGSEGDDKIIS